MATWHEITRDPEYQELSEQGKALVKQGFFEREISSDPEFKAFSPQTQKAVFDDFWQTPDDTGQGIVTSTLGSAIRGAGEIVPGTLQGVGALTGITPISDLGESARAGLEYVAPVNPIYEQGIPAKVANVAGNVASIIGTSGVGGLAGKVLGAERAAAAGSAAARQALTNQAIQAGAKSALYGTGFAQGAAAKAEENKRLGITGAEGYLNLLGGGVSELAPEMLPFGTALESAAARRLLGGVDDAAGRVIPGIRMSAAQEAAEGGSTQVLSNLSTQFTAPTGVEAPDLFEGAGEAALWEGVGGAMFGAINKLGRTPPERQTDIQKAFVAEANADAVDTVPVQSNEEKQANMDAGGIPVVDPQGNTAFIAPVQPPPSQVIPKELVVKANETSPDVSSATAAFVDLDEKLRKAQQEGVAADITAAQIKAQEEAAQAQAAAERQAQLEALTPGLPTPPPQVAPTELPAVTPSPAMEMPEKTSQTITDSNGEIAPEMSVLPPTVQAGAGAGEAIQPQPIETAPDAIQEQITDEGLLRQERPEMELQGLGEGNAQPQEVAAEGQIQEEVAPPITPQGTPTPATETLGVTPPPAPEVDTSETPPRAVNAPLDPADKQIDAPIAAKNGYVVFERPDGKRYKLRDNSKTPPEWQNAEGKRVMLKGFGTRIGNSFLLQPESKNSDYNEKAPVGDTVYHLYEEDSGRGLGNLSATELFQTGWTFVEEVKPAEATPITPQGTPTPATVGTVMPGGSAIERDATRLSRGKPRESIAFKKPVITPLGEVVGYSWSSQLVEDVDKAGEPILRRVSNWEEAANNAETGRDIVHRFLIRKPDGSASEVSLESTFGKMTASDKQTIKSVISAAKRLPFMRAELAELQDLQKRSDEDYQRTQKLVPDPAKFELREPDVEWRKKTGDKVAYLDGVFLEYVRGSDLNTKGELPSKAKFIYDNAWKWQGAQRKVEITPAQSDRLKSITRSVKKAEELLKKENVEVAKVTADEQPSSLAETGPPVSDMKTTSVTTDQPAPISYEPTNTKRGRQGSVDVGIPSGSAEIVSPSGSTIERPSLGVTGKQILGAWRSIQGVQVAPGETVVGRDVNGGGTYAFINDRLVKLRRNDRGFETTYTEATDGDWQNVSDALDRGALQVEVRKITGLGGYQKADAGKTVRVLHQATGRPLQEFLDTPEGSAYEARMQKAIADRGPKQSPQTTTVAAATEGAVVDVTPVKAVESNAGKIDNSKVHPSLISADGTRKQLYHGKAGEFADSELKINPNNMTTLSGIGPAWFTTNKAQAYRFSVPKGNIMAPDMIALKKPLVIEGDEDSISRGKMLRGLLDFDKSNQIKNKSRFQWTEKEQQEWNEFYPRMKAFLDSEGVTKFKNGDSLAKFDRIEKMGASPNHIPITEAFLRRLDAAYKDLNHPDADPLNKVQRLEKEARVTLRAAGDPRADKMPPGEAIRLALQIEGYDGIVLLNTMSDTAKDEVGEGYQPSDWVIPFTPQQVVSKAQQSPQTEASAKQTAAPSAKEAAVASVVQQPVEGSIPTVEQESATTAIESTEKTDVAKEAMRFLEADLTDTQRAKWTPEMFTAAQTFFDSGGKDFDSLKKVIKFPRVVQQAYLKADKEAAAEQTRREAADAAMAREVEKAEKEQAKLEADQKQREELGLKTLNSLIEKTRTNVVQGTVKSSDANQAVAILNKSGAIPNVLFTWIGTSKDFLADPANRARYPETWKAVSSNPNIEGMSENGQPIVFTDNVGVSDLDRNLAKLQGTTPEVAAVRRVILHENIHKGMFFLSLKDKMKLFQFLHRLYSPEELDQLAKSYDEYSDWRINQVSYFSIIEEAMTRDFDSMAEIPRDGIWAEFMQFLRDIWQKITGKTSEPTLKNYKDVFRLIRNSLKNSEKANADRLKNGGEVRMSMSEFISNVTPEQDAAYAKAVADGDMETAQRMVDEAAKAARYTERYDHGTPNKEFTTFNLPDASKTGVARMGPGIYGAAPSDTQTTNTYARNGRVIPMYVNMDKVVLGDSLDEKQVADMLSVLDADKTLRDGNKVGRFIDQYRNSDSLNEMWGLFQITQPEKWYEAVSKAGIEGATRFSAGVENGEIVLFKQSKVKSADPVTYDESGNVIPLSRRFQSASNDIRFSKVTYDSPNEAAFNSGAEVARNADYDERDKAVRSTIRAAYDLAPKPNGPSVPLDQLFDIAKQSMPDLTENEFSQILQDLYEDSGALLQAGESPFSIFNNEGERAGSAIIMPPTDMTKDDVISMLRGMSAANPAPSGGINQELYDTVLTRLRDFISNGGRVPLPIQLDRSGEANMDNYTGKKAGLGGGLRQGSGVGRAGQTDSGTPLFDGLPEGVQGVIPQAQRVESEVSRNREAIAGRGENREGKAGARPDMGMASGGYTFADYAQIASRIGARVQEVSNDIGGGLAVMADENGATTILINAAQLSERMAGISFGLDEDGAIETIGNALVEELIHAADLAVQREAWIASGRRKPFTEFATNSDKSMLDEMREVVASSNDPVKATQILHDAIQASRQLYGAGATPSDIDELFSSPKGNISSVMSEFVRQMIQQDMHQTVSEASLFRRFIERVMKMLQKIRDAIAPAKAGEFGDILKNRINETEMMLAMAYQQTGARASMIDSDSPATNEYKQNIDAANTGKAKAPFGGVQFTNFMPIDRAVKSAEEYSEAAIKYVNNLENEGVSLDNIANSVISPAFLESIGIEQDLMAQDALTIEVRQRVDNAARKAKSPDRKKQLSKLSERLSAFWQGVGSKKGQHLGQRRYLVNKARYSWMFIRELAEKAMKEARTNILISNFGSENATSFTQNSYADSDKANQQAVDENINAVEESQEFDQDAADLAAGEATLTGAFLKLYEELKDLIRQNGLIAKARDSRVANAAKASISDTERNAIMSMSDAELNALESKNNKRIGEILNTLLGKEADANTPEKKTVRNKREKMVEVAKKRADKGQPIDPAETANDIAIRLLNEFENKLAQSAFFNSSTKPDTIVKAFREQISDPMDRKAFKDRLMAMEVTSEMADRLFDKAARTKDNAQWKRAQDMLEGPNALRNIIREINRARPGDQAPLSKQIPWRELLSQNAKTVEEYRQRIFDAISANEELKSATPDQKARLADLFAEAWESNRTRILDGMLERMIRAEEAKKNLSKEGAKALQAQRMRIVEDINLGIFDNDELAKRMADKFGIKSEFTEMEREKINSLIEVLQDEGLNAVKRQVAAYKLLEVLQGELKIPVAKMLADFWVSSVLSGPNTIVSIGLAVASGAFELSTALSRVFIAGFTNPKQLPSELAGAYKTLARLLSAFGRQANIAWQYLVTGDPAFLDPSMNDVTENMQWANIGKSNQLAEQMAKSDKILVKSAGLFMRTVSRLLKALDVFNSGLTKEGSLSIVFRQIGLDPEKIAALEKKSDLKPYKDAIIQKDFGGIPPKSLHDKAIVDSYALADMMKELDKFGKVSENANQMAMQGAMTLEPSGLGGVGYRAIRSLVTNAEAGSDRFLKQAQRGWSDSAQNGDRILSGLELAFAYLMQFSAYNVANFGGVRFARFAGNKFNQGLSFIPGIGFARAFEAEFDPDRIIGKEAFIDSIQRNQLIGVMLSVGGYYLLKAIAEEPDDEKRGGLFINGGWGNLTPEKKQQKLAAGEKEYTIGYNDTVFSYANWPISSALAAIGSLADLIRFSPDQWNDKNVVQIMASAAMSGAAAAADIPALSQFQELFGNSLSSKDPNEKRMERFAKVMSSYAGGFVPRFLKDIDYSQDPNLRKYETLWEKTASHIPVYRRYEGKEYYDILGQQIQRNIYPGSREFMTKPTDPAYKVLGALNSRGIWLTPANAEHRMVGKGARRRSLTQEEADNYSLETGKGYKQMLLRYGQRALQMPTERAKAFLLDKADDVRDRALKKVYRGYTPAS